MITYLSLFSGIGGFELGIREVYPQAKCLGYSEINPSSITIYQRHFPEHKNLGDVRSIIDLEPFVGKVDLLVGGSPCQNFSYAGNRKGLEGAKSGLLLEYVRILHTIKPKYFILENVKMSREHQDEISGLLGCEPVLINSNICSYQKRNRLYWCNFNISNIPKLPAISGTMANILLDEESSEAGGMIHKTVSDKDRGSMNRRINSILNGKPLPNSRWFKIIRREDRSMRTINKTDAHYEWIVIEGKTIRRMHPIERERIQTFPDNWTSGVSNTRRYQLLGDAVTCKIISLIVANISFDKTNSSSSHRD